MHKQLLPYSAVNAVKGERFRGSGRKKPEMREDWGKKK